MNNSASDREVRLVVPRASEALTLWRQMTEEGKSARDAAPSLSENLRAHAAIRRDLAPLIERQFAHHYSLWLSHLHERNTRQHGVSDEYLSQIEARLCEGLQAGGVELVRADGSSDGEQATPREALEALAGLVVCHVPTAEKLAQPVSAARRCKPELLGLANFADIFSMGLRKRLRAMVGDYQTDINRLYEEGRDKTAAWNKLLAWATAFYYIVCAPIEFLYWCCQKIMKLIFAK